MIGPLSAHSGQKINFVGIQKIQKKNSKIQILGIEPASFLDTKSWLNFLGHSHCTIYEVYMVNVSAASSTKTPKSSKDSVTLLRRHNDEIIFFTSSYIRKVKIEIIIINNLNVHQKSSKSTEMVFRDWNRLKTQKRFFQKFSQAVLISATSAAVPFHGNIRRNLQGSWIDSLDRTLSTDRTRRAEIDGELGFQTLATMMLYMKSFGADLNDPKFHNQYNNKVAELKVSSIAS